MAFGDDFAAALGGSLGVSVDPALFDPPEATAQQLSDFKSFIDGLDQASLASLDAVTGLGVNLSQASTQAAISWGTASIPRSRGASSSGRRPAAIIFARLAAVLIDAAGIELLAGAGAEVAGRESEAVNDIRPSPGPAGRLTAFSNEGTGDGFNSGTGIAVGTALEGFTIQPDPVAAGKAVTSQIVIVSSHEELMDNLGMSSDAQGRYGFMSASARASFTCPSQLCLSCGALLAGS